MPVEVPNAFQTIAEISHPGVIGTMTALSQFRKQAIAKQAEEEQQQGQADTEVSLHVKDGRPVINVKNMPANDPADEADKSSATLQGNLDANVETYNALNKRAQAAGPTMDRKTAWKRAYAEALMRTRGGIIGSMTARDIADTTPDQPSPESELASKYYKENVAPLVSEVRVTKSEANAEKRFKLMMEKDDYERIKGIDFGSPEAKTKTPGEIASTILGHPATPAQESLANLIASHQGKVQETSRVKQAADATAKLKIEDVAGTVGTPAEIRKTAQTIAATVPGGMLPDELDRLTTKLTGYSNEWKLASAQKKAAIAREQEGLNLQRMHEHLLSRQIQQQDELAKLNTPQAASEAAKTVLQDGNQLFTLPNKTPMQQAFRAQVEDLVRKSAGGRLPEQIKPDSEDGKRLSSLYALEGDVNMVENLYDKWQAKGAPIGGPTASILNKAIVANKPTAYLARVAESSIPGYSKLSPAEKDQFITDAATMAHRINSMTGRETRAITGGRFAVQLFDVFAGTTPGFQSPDTFKGLTAGVRQEIGNVHSAIRKKQWGGVDPLGQQPNAGQGGTVLHWNVQKKAWE